MSEFTLFTFYYCSLQVNNVDISLLNNCNIVNIQMPNDKYQKKKKQIFVLIVCFNVDCIHNNL